MLEHFLEAWQHMVDKLYGWMDTAITNLPNFLLALVVFALTYYLSRKLSNWVKVPLRKFTQQESILIIASKITSVVIVAVGLLIALGIMNLSTVLKSLLAGAGVAGLAIGLALQGTLSNSFSGLYLAVKEIISVGDFVETNGYKGHIEEITLRYTALRETDNNIVIIPNKQVLENPFKNYGLTKQVRVTIECGISYDANLREVKEFCVEGIREKFPHDVDKDIEFYWREFGGSSINFMMRFWVEAQAKMTILESQSEAIMTLKEILDEHDIEIPYPIRSLELRNETIDLNSLAPN